MGWLRVALVLGCASDVTCLLRHSEPCARHRQQPDAQRDPSQGEIQINGMSSILEGLRKRDCSQTIALVSNTDFGDAFIHSILRDNVEEYLAVITSTGIQVFDLDGVLKRSTPQAGYGYLSSVTDAQSNIRAVTIADYTFISNTKTSPAMNTATAPATARPATHEALIWVRAANYGQTYRSTSTARNVQ